LRLENTYLRLGSEAHQEADQPNRIVPAIVYRNFRTGGFVWFGMGFKHVVEEIQVMGTNLVEKVKELIHEGNVQRVIIKNEQGYTLVEIPVTIAVIGGVAAPVLAAVGAIATVVTKCTVVVERREPPVTAPPPPPAA
jgi:hypothetical protein